MSGTGDDQAQIVRNARLRGGLSAENGESEPEHKRQLTGDSKVEMNSTQYDQLKRLMIGQNVTGEDMSRWYSQGFQFCTEAGIEWGLKQGHGGPCGILASVQAEMIREMIFNSDLFDGSRLPTLSIEQVNRIFAKALCNILVRASCERNVLFVELISNEGRISCDTTEKELVIQKIVADETHVVDHILHKIEMYRRY